MQKIVLQNVSCFFLIETLKCIDFITKKKYNKYATFYFYNKEFFQSSKMNNT